MRAANHQSWEGQLVSVVIPTWNQNPERLAAAVASAKASTYPCEVIIVDDGSDEPIPNALRIPHSGISAALNAGIHAAAGDWICWLSSDDEMDADKIETQLRETFAAGAAASFHSYRIRREGLGIAGQSWAKQWRTMDEQRTALLSACPINGSTTMINRAVFSMVGMFDTELKYGQDWDMWCRIGRAYRWHGIKRILGTRHEWPGNLTARIEAGHDSQRRNTEDQEIRSRHTHPGLWRI